PAVDPMIAAFNGALVDPRELPILIAYRNSLFPYDLRGFRIKKPQCLAEGCQAQAIFEPEKTHIPVAHIRLDSPETLSSTGIPDGRRLVLWRRAREHRRRVNSATVEQFLVPVDLRSAHFVHKRPQAYRIVSAAAQGHTSVRGGRAAVRGIRVPLVS